MRERERGADFPHRLRWDMIQCLQDIGYQGADVLHAIADGDNYQDGDWQCCEVLLKFDVLVGGKEDIELGGRKRQQLPVLDSGPSASRHGSSFMTDQ